MYGPSPARKASVCWSIPVAVMYPAYRWSISECSGP
jgi:hypothetical protein